MEKPAGKKLFTAAERARRLKVLSDALKDGSLAQEVYEQSRPDLERYASLEARSKVSARTSGPY